MVEDSAEVARIRTANEAAFLAWQATPALNVRAPYAHRAFYKCKQGMTLVKFMLPRVLVGCAPHDVRCTDARRPCLLRLSCARVAFSAKICYYAAFAHEARA